MKKKNCDMCGSPVIDGRCACGAWTEETPIEAQAFEEALKRFHSMERMTLTADAPHLGCASIYFRGDYKDCKEVEKLIYKLKKRPYYDKKS